jgi:integrase
MPVRKHGDGWEARVQSAGRRFSKTFGTRQDALSWEGLVRRRINDRELGRAPDYTIEEAVQRWLTGEAKALRSHRNLKNKVRAIHPHINRGRTLGQIPDAAGDIIKAGLKDGLAVATINRRLAVLRRVARLAQRSWNWTEKAITVTLLPGERERRVQASQDELQRLMAAAGPKAATAILYGVLTGLRRGELLGLKPGHFRDGAIVLETRTKTDRPRVVPLPAELKKRPYPFDLTSHELEDAWRNARRATGLTHLQWRDLRRTYGSWIVQNTGSLKAAQDLLGHTSSAITSRHYAHLLPGNLREAVATLPKLAGQARGKKNRKKAA